MPFVKFRNLLHTCWSLGTTFSTALIYSFSGSANFTFYFAQIPSINNTYDAKSSISNKSRFSLPLAYGSQASSASLLTTKEIVIVDGAVEEPETLIKGLAVNTKVYYLNSKQDGIEQISQILGSHQKLNAIHILAHGSAGQLNLGSGRLNSLTLHSQAEQLKAWGQALALTGDILLYGCDFAQGAIGQAATQTLAQLTDADIAASNDYTGSKSLGGDWNLEVNQGKIEANLTLNYFAQSNYNYVFEPTVANPDLPANTCNTQVDLMFILDESGSVSASERVQQRNAVRATLDYLVDNNINARAAIVEYNNTARTLTLVNGNKAYIQVNASTISTTVGSEGALELAIQNYGDPFTDRQTNWEAGFNEALTIVSSPTGGYPDSLFFFTDGIINNGGSADNEADNFKDNGTHIYTIAIGDNAANDIQNALYDLTDGDPTNPPGSLPGSENYDANNPNPVPADHVNVANYTNLSSDLLNFVQDACLPSASLTKEFDADTIVPTEVSTLTFTISNIDGNPVRSEINFTDELPENVTIIYDPPNPNDDSDGNGYHDDYVTNTCNGSLTDSSGATNGTETIGLGDTGITLTGGSLALNQTSCQISIKVTSNRDVASATDYINNNNNISNSNNINTDNLSATLKVNPFPVSPLAGKLIINEVLYQGTGGSVALNSEFIELFNATSNESIDLTGLKLSDGNLLATNHPNQDDRNFIIGARSYTFGTTPPGGNESGNLVLEPGQYAVVWIGPNSSTNNAPGASFQAWLNRSPKLKNEGDDIWLYNTDNSLIDYIAYGDSDAINARPDPNSWDQWDLTNELNLDGAANEQSISLTPNGIDGNTSVCWEATTSNASENICNGYLPTIDSDPLRINNNERITSVGANNNGKANLILVKRITNLSPNRNNIDFNTVVDDGIADSNDDDDRWLNNYLTGQTNLEDIQPGDEIEYTIYFLSNGGRSVQNAQLCDVVPDNMSFVTNSFENASGISLSFEGAVTAIPNAIINDQGFHSPNAPSLPTSCQKVDPNSPPNMEKLIPVTSADNNSGAVVVNLESNLPSATDTNTPSNSYGYIRFRVRLE